MTNEVTGWQWFLGSEPWPKYIARWTMTSDLIAAQRESVQRIIEIIPKQSAEMLLGSSHNSDLSTLSRQIKSLPAAIQSAVYDASSDLTLGVDYMSGIMSNLSKQISDLTGEVKSLNITFHWGFSSMLAQMGRMNDSYDELIRIARAPEKTRAMEFFYNARDLFRRKFYAKSLSELDRAINTHEFEWRFYQLRGLLRLGFFGCNINLIDLPKAEKDFVTAAGYAEADYPEEAAMAYLSAGWTAYVQGKLSEGENFTIQANDRVMESCRHLDTDDKSGYPLAAEIRFQLAKIYMAENKVKDALETLNWAMLCDPFYALKAASDGDFKKHKETLSAFFEEKKKTTVREILSNANDFLEEVEYGQTVPAVLEFKPQIKWDRRNLEECGLLQLLLYHENNGFEADEKKIRIIYENGVQANTIREERKLNLHPETGEVFKLIYNSEEINYRPMTLVEAYDPANCKKWEHTGTPAPHIDGLRTANFQLMYLGRCENWEDVQKKIVANSPHGGSPRGGILKEYMRVYPKPGGGRCVGVANARWIAPDGHRVFPYINSDGVLGFCWIKNCIFDGRWRWIVFAKELIHNRSYINSID